MNNKKASRRGIDKIELPSKIDASNKTEMVQRANTQDVNKEVKLV